MIGDGLFYWFTAFDNYSFVTRQSTRRKVDPSLQLIKKWPKCSSSYRDKYVWLLVVGFPSQKWKNMYSLFVYHFVAEETVCADVPRASLFRTFSTLYESLLILKMMDYILCWMAGGGAAATAAAPKMHFAKISKIVRATIYIIYICMYP